MVTMYNTVIGRLLVLLTILQLSTSAPLNTSKYTYEDIFYHLEWNDTRTFCGGYAVVIVQGLCGYEAIKSGKQLAEICCREPCTLRKLKAVACQSNFDPRPYLDIAAKIQIPITTTTVKPTPEPTYLKIIRGFYDFLQPRDKHPMYFKHH